MKLILIFTLLVGVQVINANLDDELGKFVASLTSKSSGGSYTAGAKNLFSLYKNEFNRNSKTESEEKLRFESFNKTLSTIVDHRRQGDKAFTLGLNQYSDWTQAEMAQLRGVRVPKGDIKSTNAKSGQRLLTWDGRLASSKTTPPASFDYTTRVVSGTSVPVIGAIKNQGRCGSCYAFSFSTLLEFQYAVQLKSSTTLSEQQLVDCSKGDSACGGGYFTNTFTYIQGNTWQVNGGTSYPYTAVAATCKFKSTGNGGVKFGSLLYSKVATSATAMQQALVDYGPLWVSVFVGDQTTAVNTGVSTSFGTYRSGVFQPAGCPTLLSSTNHAVVIVGYGVDSTTNIPYWKVRNSWGTSWGESGYFKIRRGVNMCGIESGAFYIGKPA